MLLLAASLILTSAPVPPSQWCALNRLQTCRDTNQLIWAPAFDRAVRRFLGGRRGDYLYRGRTVADQALAVLGGPPDPPQRVGDLYRFTACRSHSCGEKGVAVLEPSGRVVALGILHTDCALRTHQPDCFAHDTLTLFVRDQGRSETVVKNLSAWAKSAAAEYSGNGIPPTHLDRVQVVQVSSNGSHE
jgi:hypothetical protein